MRVPMSWVREYVEAPTDPQLLEPALVSVGLEVESIVDLRGTVTGPLVVGRVLSFEPVAGAKKPIRYCQVEVGAEQPRGIICGATNFAEGDEVVVALPGAVLPGGFVITARKTYGHVSDGMICSARELGLGEDHSGIIVLPADLSAAPGDDARPVVGLDDVVVELAVTPDRGYCLSIRGIARELSHSLGLPFTDPASVATRGGAADPTAPGRTADLLAPGGTAQPPHSVTVEDPAGCDRFAARLVRGVDPGAQSPQWMQRRLVHAGMRPISLAVDITNYLMLELGQPMHAFDADRIAGPLVVRRSRPGERLVTLDGVERALDPEDMVICDAGLPNPLAGEGAGVPISLAAVMGGATSEVSDSTVSVLFEAAHWDPVMVARTARRHKLFSEAAKRWERGVDPSLPLPSLERAVALLTEYAGGTVDERVLDLSYVDAREPVRMAADLPARTAGVPYELARVAALLEEVGCTVAVDGDTLTVTPPIWRPDLTDPADFAEEVIRLDGYDVVPSVLPVAPPGNGLTPRQRRRRSVGITLAENGYVEVLSYPFVGTEVLDALGLPADDPRRDTVRLANPLSEEEPALRTTLLPPLLQTLRRNIGRGMRDLALYELGAVFHPRRRSDAQPRLGVATRPSDVELAEAETYVPDQPWHAATVLAGEVEPTGWWGAGRPATWADAIEAARLVIAAAGVAGDRVEVRRGTLAPWHPGRCAEVLVDGEVVGHAGELHPAACTALDLPRRTCAAEVVLDALPLPGITPAPEVSSFPPALIDVALIVDAQTPAAAVEKALREGAGDLLESIRPFDVYVSEQLGKGRKSLAYKLTFRAGDRTLTVEEALAARDSAVAAARERLGAVLRGA